jgi:hypothetical protein
LQRTSLKLHVFDKGSSQLVLIPPTFWKRVLLLSTGTMRNLTEGSVGQSQSQSQGTVTKTRQLQNINSIRLSSSLNKYNQLPQSELGIELKRSITTRTFYFTDGPQQHMYISEPLHNLTHEANTIQKKLNNFAV